MSKFYEQVCLLNQTYIKDDKKKISDLVDEATAKMGEKIEIVTGIKRREKQPTGAQIANPPIYVTGDMMKFSYELLEQ